MIKSVTQVRVHLTIMLSTCVIAFCVSDVSAQLKAGQARSLISRVAGSEFSNSAVRVKQVEQESEKSASVLAEIETAFRFELNANEQWRVRDIRVGPQRWEDVTAFWGPRANESTHASPCDGGSQGSVLNVKRARCLLAALLGVDLPSDAVRIKDVSTLGLPLASNPSAVVVAVIQMEFKFEKQGKGWLINGVRTGTRDWNNSEDMKQRADEMKRQQASADLRLIADALGRYRQDRGFYVTTDQHRVLIDHLAPHYLARIVRLDPWHKPYQYQGDKEHFTLRSDGPDGKPNTSDDLVLANQ